MNAYESSSLDINVTNLIKIIANGRSIMRYIRLIKLYEAFVLILIRFPFS